MPGRNRLAEQEVPVFALFGRRQGLPIAGVGPDQVAAGRTAVQRLIAIGHQRIVLLVRQSQRSAGIGTSERAILDEMETYDLPTSSYNLPDWEDSPRDSTTCWRNSFASPRPRP